MNLVKKNNQQKYNYEYIQFIANNTKNRKICPTCAIIHEDP